MSSGNVSGAGSRVVSANRIEWPYKFLQISREEQALICDVERYASDGMDGEVRTSLITRIENFIGNLERVSKQMERTGRAADVATLEKAKQDMEARLAAVKKVSVRSSRLTVATDFSPLWDKERQLTAAFETRCYSMPYDADAMDKLAQDMKGLIGKFEAAKQGLERAGQEGQGDAWVMEQSLQALRGKLAQVEGMIAFYQPREQAAVQTIHYAGLSIDRVPVEVNRGAGLSPVVLARREVSSETIEPRLDQAAREFDELNALFDEQGKPSDVDQAVERTHDLLASLYRIERELGELGADRKKVDVRSLIRDVEEIKDSLVARQIANRMSDQPSLEMIWSQLTEESNFVPLVHGAAYLRMAQQAKAKWDKVRAQGYFEKGVALLSQIDFREVPMVARPAFLAKFEEACKGAGEGKIAREGYQKLAELATIHGDRSLRNRATAEFSHLVRLEVDGLVREGKEAGQAHDQKSAIEKFKAALTLLQELSPRQRTTRQDAQADFCKTAITELGREVWLARGRKAYRAVVGLFGWRGSRDATASADTGSAGKLNQ